MTGAEVVCNGRQPDRVTIPEFGLLGFLNRQLVAAIENGHPVR